MIFTWFSVKLIHEMLENQVLSQYCEARKILIIFTDNKVSVAYVIKHVAVAGIRAHADHVFIHVNILFTVRFIHKFYMQFSYNFRRQQRNES